MTPTDFKVLYGPKHQFKAYFDDRAKAEHYVVHHENAVIVKLYEESDDLQSNDPNRSSADSVA